MPPLRNRIPSYLPHKQSGRARIVWYDSSGCRRQQLLPGSFNSSESRTAFARLQLELVASHSPSIPDRSAIVMAEMLCAYLNHAERHYRKPDGSLTSEIYEIRIVIRALRGLYADTPVSEFGPLALKAARQKWVDDGCSRSEVNRRVSMVKRIIKWATSEQLAPPGAFHALATVSGLAKGRTPAHELEPVGPVADVVVEATLPHLSRQVRGLVEFQRLTGCRPGEACAVRRCDLDISERIWVYRPPHHKNSWRGDPRTIAIGPKAQDVLKAFFSENPDAYLFDPRQAVSEMHAARAAMRKTPRRQTDLARNATKRAVSRNRVPAEMYNSDSYALAVDRACDRAFPPPEPLAQRDDETHAAWWARLNEQQRHSVKTWRKAHRWSPNQLRHSFASMVRRKHGLEAAQVALGHSHADVTQVYAERNDALAATIAARVG